MRFERPYRQAAEALQQALGVAPRGAILLGSGAGPLMERWPHRAAPVPYPSVGLPKTSVAGHLGALQIVEIHGEPVALLSGRMHSYEGHSDEVMLRTVRALARWGVERVVLTSAVGGLRTSLPPGSLVRITDHINLGGNPLIGPNDPELGVRFPDLTHAYDPTLGAAAAAAAAVAGVTLHEGVYANVSGPSYETPAEVRMLAAMGGDVVGMSMARECIGAVHAGLSVLGISVVSNLAAGLSAERLDHEEVLAVVGEAVENLARLLEELVRRW